MGDYFFIASIGENVTSDVLIASHAWARSPVSNLTI